MAGLMRRRLLGGFHALGRTTRTIRNAIETLDQHSQSERLQLNSKDHDGGSFRITIDTMSTP